MILVDLKPGVKHIHAKLSESQMFPDIPKNQRILTSTTWQKLADLIKSQPITNPKAGISDSVRRYVWIRDEGLCVYCKSDMYLQYDHVIPVSYGGPAIQENIVLACEPCNQIKTNSFRIDFLTIAFNHLLYVGETLDWIDKIFCSKDEDEENELDYDILCLNCGNPTILGEWICSPNCKSDLEFDDELLIKFNL